MPVRKKYWPESNALRHGVQLGALTKALRNVTPSRAIRSNVGVFTTSLGEGRPSSCEYAPAYRPQSSAKQNNILGRFVGSAAATAFAQYNAVTNVTHSFTYFMAHTVCGL